MSAVTRLVHHSEALPVPRSIGVASEKYSITNAEEKISQLLSTSDDEYLPSREDGPHLVINTKCL